MRYFGQSSMPLDGPKNWGWAAVNAAYSRLNNWRGEVRSPGGGEADNGGAVSKM